MAKFDPHNQIHVSMQGSEYTVTIYPGALRDENFLRNLVHSKQVLIVSNPTVAAFYLQDLKQVFAGIQCDTVLLPDGEQYKNQDSLTLIYNALLRGQHHRDTTLIALGGGVIGDITGFAAATYQRGVNFIQMPTSLLAQVDASVGGKTAINHPLGKNMIGSFYQPQAVLIDLHTLITLPKREFNAGLAEIIKYGLLVGGSFLEELQRALFAGISAQSEILLQIVADCCRIKANMVSVDEREHGIRALLNLGHTFAHALEAYTNYETWLHGEAVAIGLYCAALLSFEMGLIPRLAVEQVRNMLELAHLPYRIPSDVDLNQLKCLMALDKKVKNNQLRFVILRHLGSCYLEDKVPEACLERALMVAAQGE